MKPTIPMLAFIAGTLFAATIAGANGDKDSDCWQTHFGKGRLVFANVCSLEAFQVRLKEIPPLP